MLYGAIHAANFLSVTPLCHSLHGGNTGSNAVGDAISFQQLAGHFTFCGDIWAHNSEPELPSCKRRQTTTFY